MPYVPPRRPAASADPTSAPGVESEPLPMTAPPRPARSAPAYAGPDRPAPGDPGRARVRSRLAVRSRLSVAEHQPDPLALARVLGTPPR